MANNIKSKVLIAYYSYSGNTRSIAEEIKNQTGGKIFEILPTEAYPTSYNACVSKARKECGSKFKPELVNIVPDIEDYDTIFIGTPNWCSTMAPPVLSFIAKHNMEGKKVIPFVTHGGGGMARCEADIQKACSGSTFAKAIGLYNNSNRNNETTLSEWIAQSI